LIYAPQTNHRLGERLGNEEIEVVGFPDGVVERRHEKRQSAMKTTIQLVEEFHRASGLPVKARPDLSDERVNELRLQLLQEELNELQDAIESGDTVAALDALVDLQYVLDGAFLSLGFSKHPAFEEVHRSNMSKLDDQGLPIRRADGKILKGPNYSPPDLTRYV
jgi:predicted HAD superfamily Cof-like phosphohydrolase